MSSRSLTFVGFGVIVGAAVVWQVVAVLSPHRATIGHVQRWVMGSLVVRILLFAFLGLAGTAPLRPGQRLIRIASTGPTGAVGATRARRPVPGFGRRVH